MVEEAESATLRELLADEPRGSCELAVTEVPRAVRRLTAGRGESERRYLLSRADAVLEYLTLLSVDRGTLLVAAAFEDSALRSLDAIHIACALSTGSDLEAFVSYDRRQVEAASSAGLHVVSPAPT